MDFLVLFPVVCFVYAWVNRLDLTPSLWDSKPLNITFNVDFRHLMIWSNIAVIPLIGVYIFNRMVDWFIKSSNSCHSMVILVGVGTYVLDLGLLGTGNMTYILTAVIEACNSKIMYNETMFNVFCIHLNMCNCQKSSLFRKYSK